MASQKKNLMTIAMQSFSICSLVTLTWMFFGYSLAFTSYSGVIGGSSRFFLLNLSSGVGHPLAPSIPEHIFCTYQLGNFRNYFVRANIFRIRYYHIVRLIFLRRYRQGDNKHDSSCVFMNKEFSMTPEVKTTASLSSNHSDRHQIDIPHAKHVPYFNQSMFDSVISRSE